MSRPETESGKKIFRKIKTQIDELILAPEWMYLYDIQFLQQDSRNSNIQ